METENKNETKTVRGTRGYKFIVLQEGKNTMIERKGRRYTATPSRIEGYEYCNDCEQDAIDICKKMNEGD